MELLSGKITVLSFGSFHGKMLYISMTTKNLMSYQTNRSLESELA